VRVEELLVGKVLLADEVEDAGTDARVSEKRWSGMEMGFWGRGEKNTYRLSLGTMMPPKARVKMAYGPRSQKTLSGASCQWT
jgi:hypothetical protein